MFDVKGGRVGLKAIFPLDMGLDDGLWNNICRFTNL